MRIVPYSFETFPKDRVPWVRYKYTSTNKAKLIVGLHDNGPWFCRDCGYRHKGIVWPDPPPRPRERDEAMAKNLMFWCVGEAELTADEMAFVTRVRHETDAMKVVVRGTTLHMLRLGVDDGREDC